VGSKGALGTAPCLGRIRRDHLNPQAFHGFTELGQMYLVHFSARFGRRPVVAAAIGVEGAEQPALLDHVPNALETARCAFLLDEEHRVVLVASIVHRHNQIPLLTRHPFMGRAVLMQQHPR
jgi:hypothetical protein